MRDDRHFAIGTAAVTGDGGIDLVSERLGRFAVVLSPVVRTDDQCRRVARLTKSALSQIIDQPIVLLRDRKVSDDIRRDKIRVHQLFHLFVRADEVPDRTRPDDFAIQLEFRTHDPGYNNSYFLHQLSSLSLSSRPSQ